MEIVNVQHIKTISITDPDTNLEVELSIYKDTQSNAIVGIDQSYIINNDDIVRSPYNCDSRYNDDQL